MQGQFHCVFSESKDNLTKRIKTLRGSSFSKDLATSTDLFASIKTSDNLRKGINICAQCSTHK